MSTDLAVAAFYQFVDYGPEEIISLRQRLLDFGQARGLSGTVLLAKEGINGTVSGEEKAVADLLALLRSDSRLESMEAKISWVTRPPFHRFKVRLKREIVSMGCAEVRPAQQVGTYVAPAQWDALIADPDTLIIDTRNHYEVAVGSFPGALDPATTRFRDFPAWVEQTLRPMVARRQPQALALFCTGGIRCEKATAYLLQQGFEGVHHLQGGILGYLEHHHSSSRGLWEGECFVFDQRVALNHRLEPGDHSLCHACRLPLTPLDRRLPSFEDGVSCRHCIDRCSDADRQRFRERQRQILVARSHDELHLGRCFPGQDLGRGHSPGT